MQISYAKSNSDQEIANFSKLQSEKSKSDNKYESDDDKPKTQRTSSDPVFLNKIRPEQAREFLDNSIGRAVAEFSFSSSQSSQTQITQSSFSASYSSSVSSSFSSSFTNSFNDSGATISSIISNITQAFNSISKTTGNNTQTIQAVAAASQTDNSQIIPSAANLPSEKPAQIAAPVPPQVQIQTQVPTSLNNQPTNSATPAVSNVTENNVPNNNGKQLKDLIDKIQKGFNQAKDTLEQLNVLSQGFAPEFDVIQQRVNSFLQFLEDPENNNLPINNAPTNNLSTENSNNTQSIEASTIAISQESYQSNSQANIQIETRDGDIVTIDLSNSFSQQQTSAAAQYDGQTLNQSATQNTLQSTIQSNSFSGYVYEASTQSSNALTFTVSGNLDDEELAAISNLVGDISKTIGQFEKGNVTAALSLAKNIDTQSAELSGFTFSARTSEQYRAIDLYQQTQTSTTSSNSTPAASTVLNGAQNPTIQTSAETLFANNISNTIYAAENANILQPTLTVNNIFEKFYEQLSALNEERESQTESKSENEALEAVGL